MKKIIAIAGSIIIITVSMAALMVCLIINYSSDTDYTSVCVSDIKLSENQFQARLFQAASANAYQKYEYEIKDDSLYITIWSGLLNKKNRFGEMNIKIEENLSEVKAVYLKDKNNTKLIYRKE